MKLAAVYFDDTVVIPGAKDIGGGTFQDLRESSFHASDGWDIDWDGRVLFTLWREGMANVAKVGGYGFTFIAEHAAAPSVDMRGVASGVGETISEATLGNTELSGEKLLAATKRRRK